MNTGRDLVLTAALMALMGAVGCIAFGCAVAGVELASLSIKEAAGLFFGLAGLFFGLLLLANFRNLDKKH